VRGSDSKRLRPQKGSVAIYHFSVQVLKRSKGHSAVAAAAYRSGSLLRDERAGKSHDYRNRRGVVWSGILLPDGAPEGLKDRQRLWSTVEGMERREDAQLAREINLALPRELDAVRRKELLLNFVQEAFVDRGMAADVAIHEPVEGKNASPDNHHAHIMLALRRVSQAGLHPVKTREWNARALLEEWRALWSVHQNRALERAGRTERVDHRTLVAQRDEALGRGDRALAMVLDREPQLHVGPKARRVAMRDIFMSCKRPVGRVRKVPGRKETLRRVVDYPRIDRGSREAWRRLMVQQVRAEQVRRKQRLQVKAVRLRARKMALARESEVLRVNLRKIIHTRQDYRWLERKDAAWSLEESVKDALGRLSRNEARSDLLDRMIAAVDRMLARLELLQLRRTPVRGLGRVRARPHPSAFASGGPGSGGPSTPG